MAPPQVDVYGWPTCEGYLVERLFPGRPPIEGAPEDTAPDVLARVRPDARAFVFHLDCTHTARFPRNRGHLVASLAARGVRVLNARVTDISKRTVQNTCRKAGLVSVRATRRGPAGELLIVKTNLNYGGKREKEMTPRQRALLGLAPVSRGIHGALEYRVVPRRDLEDATWRDRGLAVERFVANRDHRWYRAYVLVDRVFLCELRNTALIKKVGDSRLTGSWPLTLVRGRVEGQGFPQLATRALARFLAAFSLDFGTVDILEDDGGIPYVIDVNTTPYYSRMFDGLTGHLLGAPGIQ